MLQSYPTCLTEKSPGSLYNCNHLALTTVYIYILQTDLLWCQIINANWGLSKFLSSASRFDFLLALISTDYIYAIFNFLCSRIFKNLVVFLSPTPSWIWLTHGSYSYHVYTNYTTVSGAPTKKSKYPQKTYIDHTDNINAKKGNVDFM